MGVFTRPEVGAGEVGVGEIGVGEAGGGAPWRIGPERRRTKARLRVPDRQRGCVNALPVGGGATVTNVVELDGEGQQIRATLWRGLTRTMEHQMKKRTITTLAIAAGLSMLTASPAPATTKPCRDRSGKIIACIKARKPSPRCKDSQGRFVACTAPISGEQVKTGG